MTVAFLQASLSITTLTKGPCKKWCKSQSIEIFLHLKKESGRGEKVALSVRKEFEVVLIPGWIHSSDEFLIFIITVM